MKVGDLVRHKTEPWLGMGLVTNDEHCLAGPVHDPRRGLYHRGYVWVVFLKWYKNDKWCEVIDLELISESR